MDKKRKITKNCAMKMCFKSKLKSKKCKSTKGNILILNDDCLLSVFRYMGIRDVMNVERTCTRLRDAASLYYRTMKTLEWTSDLPFASASKIICKFGCFTTSLHSLHFNGVRKPKADATIYQTNAYQHFVDTLLDNCKNIETLTFTKCDIGCEWAPFFDALQYLESLSLIDTNLRHSNYLQRMNTLKRFYLYGCHNFTSTKFNHFLFNNQRLTRLELEDCEDLSKELSYHSLSSMSIKTLSVEVYPENVEEVKKFLSEHQERDHGEELGEYFQHLKKLKIVQGESHMNLNDFLKTITKHATLDELDLFKVNVASNTFDILKSMKLNTLKLYPRFEKSVSDFCGMLVNSMYNLKHLTLVLFDPDREDFDISDEDVLMLIERLEHLESLNLHHCQCECDCDYIVCPFRCKLRSLIENINKIFEYELRPSLKLMLPKRIARTFFLGREKFQKKYRQILTGRVQLIRSDELEYNLNATSVYSRSFFADFLQYLATTNSGSEDSCSTTSYDDFDDPESHPESGASDNSWDTVESDDDAEEFGYGVEESDDDVEESDDGVEESDDDVAEPDDDVEEPDDDVKE